MATAYTILYPSENAGFGPADVAFVSVLSVLAMGSADGGGGGSMTEGAGHGFERGSGNDGIASSDDDVSMVMCFVTGGAVRSV